MRIGFNTVISRALTAGAIAGVLMGAYMFFVVEPTIDDAIAIEEARAAEEPVDPGTEEEEPLFDRDEQTAGGVAANVIYALVVSAIFGIVFAKLHHRLPGASDFTRSVWLAAVAFGVFALMPAIKYPANPPAVGDPDTVDERTVQYIACIVVSLVAAVVLTRFAGVLRRGLDRPTQVVAVAAATIVGYGLILVALPGAPDAISSEVPASLVWDFRLRSIGTLALLWAVLGLGLGWLLERDQAEAEARRAARQVVRS